jgi:hypothetical protein
MLSSSPPQPAIAIAAHATNAFANRCFGIVHLPSSSLEWTYLNGAPEEIVDVAIAYAFP